MKTLCDGYENVSIQVRTLKTNTSQKGKNSVNLHLS